MPNTQTTSGYVPCACRDCFETAIGELGQALCHECGEHGCEAGAEAECCSPSAYGGEEHACDFDGCDEAATVEEARMSLCAKHAAENAENIKVSRNATAIETLREYTEDKAPEESDFGAVAKVLNLNRFAPPTGKRWTAALVKAAYTAYIATPAK